MPLQVSVARAGPSTVTVSGPNGTLSLAGVDTLLADAAPSGSHAVLQVCHLVFHARPCFAKPLAVAGPLD